MSANDQSLCRKCGEEKEWESCGLCGGDGWYEPFEDDPNFYEPDDILPCSQCDGEGGWMVCLNPKCLPVCEAVEPQAKS